jgi:hypothetical protein
MAMSVAALAAFMQPVKGADAPAPQPQAGTVTAAFTLLKFGAIRPRGWILQQMRRDLRDGFAGHLDELCHATVTEVMRIPLWFWNATGDEEFLRIGRQAVAKPVTFCLWLRNPSWCRAAEIVCPDAEVQRVGDFWQVHKHWKTDDKVGIRFGQTIREVPAINGEVALQYGPLLYVLPIPGTSKTVKTYRNTGFQDYLMSADKGVDAKLGLPASQRNSAFGFHARQCSVAGADPDRPLDNPPVVLEGNLVSKPGGVPVPVTLVPMGAEGARLRRVTFPIVATHAN